MYEYTAFVRRIVDGDTIDLTVSLGFRIAARNRFRLLGIDTPERGQVGWAEATAELTRLAPVGTQLRIRTEKPLKSDSFGRWLADLWADDLHINEAMIEGGFAVVYTR